MAYWYPDLHRGAAIRTQPEWVCGYCGGPLFLRVKDHFQYGDQTPECMRVVYPQSTERTP